MLLRLLYRCTLLSILFLLGTTLYLQRLDPALLVETDALSEAKNLAQKNRWPEVRMLADFAADYPQNGRKQTALDLRQQADLNITDRWHTLQSFVHGAASGQAVDNASLLGTISLDMFVIGDIRDLLVQGWNAAQGRETDGLVIGLSTAGLATTLAPQLHWAPALLKALRRSRRISPKLTRILTRQLKAGEYRQAGQFIIQFAGAAWHMGPVGISGVMKWVDTPQTMTRLAKAASISSRDSYVVTRLSRGTLLAKINNQGSNIRLLAKSIRRGSRITKVLIKSARTVPTPLLWLLLAFTLLALFQHARFSRNNARLQ